MSASNTRIKEVNTVHHLTSRIAHRVFFLGEDERNDLLQMIIRASQFCGIKLLSWCIMTNHFHVLVYLPSPLQLSDDEVLNRVAILKGQKGIDSIKTMLADWQMQGEVGALRVKEWFDRQRKRMYDIGEFMKIVKQWFSEEYNRRNSHVGTLWESTYHDRVVEFKERPIETCAAYIHLNPIRGAICVGYSEYKWSSMTALAKGDSIALEGMRFIYSEPTATADSLMSRHVRILEALLEKEKRRRAEEIARKRAAGYEVPCDHLTTEAMVAQAKAYREQVLEAGVEIAEESLKYRKCIDKREDIERLIIEAIKANANIKPGEIAKSIAVPPSTIYKYLKILSVRGILTRSTRTSPWVVSEFYI